MIDFHVHPFLVREMVQRYPELAVVAREVWKIGNNLQPLETLLLELDVAGLEQAVILPIDATTTCHTTLFSNAQVAELVAQSPRLIGFASVDPHLPDAAHRLAQAVEGLGLRGLKLDPALQRFYADDREFYPLYEQAAALRIPILFHAGMSWAPNAPLKYGQPIHFENVAADFPNLNIVLAHLAWPWVPEAVALALKYPNVYLDTSALYFDNPTAFLRYAMAQQVPLTVWERSLREQIVFGSNYPRVEIKNMARAVRALGLSPDCLDLMFRTNAQRLLNGREAAA